MDRRRLARSASATPRAQRQPPATFGRTRRHGTGASNWQAADASIRAQDHGAAASASAKAAAARRRRGEARRASAAAAAAHAGRDKLTSFLTDTDPPILGEYTRYSDKGDFWPTARSTPGARTPGGCRASRPASAGSAEGRAGLASAASTDAERPGSAAQPTKKRVALSYGVRDERALLKRIGDKFYSMGDKLDKLRQQFRSMDVDQSGTLDKGELRKGLEQFNFGLDDAQIDGVVGTLDRTGDGTIDYEEFIDFFASYQPLQPNLHEEQMHPRDNVLTGAPWEPVHSRFEELLASRKRAELAPAVGAKPVYPPGSYEERRADQLLTRLIVRKFEESGPTIRSAFRAMDSDRSGGLSYEEFTSGIDKLGLGLQPQHVRRLCQMVDADGNGAIDYEEFFKRFDRHEIVGMDFESSRPSRTAEEERAAAARRDETIARIGGTRAIRVLGDTMYRSSKKLRNAFKQMDINGDGVLSQEEFKLGLASACPVLGEAEVAEVVASIDASGDGYVDYREFVNGLSALSDASQLSQARAYTANPMAGHLVPEEAQPIQPLELMNREDGAAWGARDPRVSVRRPGGRLRPRTSGGVHGSGVHSETLAMRPASAGTDSASATASTPMARSRVASPTRPRSADTRMVRGGRGRFASTPVGRNTGLVLSAPPGTPAYGDASVRRPASREQIFSAQQAQERARMRSRAEARQARIRKHSEEMSKRCARLDDDLERRQRAKLESKATAMRAHLERLKLLEMRNQDPDASGKQRTGNRTFFMSNGP